MSAIEQKRVEVILQQLETLPTLPAVAARLLQVTGQSDSSARDVVELLSSDPALSARILQMVHRADHGVPRQVSSVERAVVLLGFEAVRQAVLAVSIFHCLPREAEPDGSRTQAFDPAEFWKHAIAVGAAAELLAGWAPRHGPHGRVDPGEAFLCGLLHDLGKIALHVALPRSFDRVVEAVELLRGDIADLERQVIGLDHMVAGKRLAERWNLPAQVREVIWLHGQRPASLPVTVANPGLINLITLADILARRQHIGFSGNHTFAVPMGELMEATGLSAERIEKVERELMTAIERRSEALGLDDTDSAQLYQQALASANRQLGQVSAQLAEKNQRLGMRARFFDALAGFQEELRPDASPRQTLAAVGQTAVGVLQVECCCAFSLPPSCQWAEAVLLNDAGAVLDTTIIDYAADSDRGAGGIESLDGAMGPVCPTGQELEWLMATVSPRLEHERRFWIPLRSDGRCIGGVVWGAPAGESNRLGAQVRELSTLASGWSLALRTAQIRDESRQLAEQLAEANRRLQNAQNELTRGRAMLGIGEMAAGAAHEMNNPLAIISGRSQLLASQLEDPKLKRAAGQIYEQSHRISEIITELMEFARPQPPHIEMVDAGELIEQALDEAKALPEAGACVVESSIEELPPVQADARQVVGALREILHNAMRAAGDEGRVTIQGGCDQVGRRIVIQVTDDGSGMDENTARHAFDPFYSHHPAGRRRGMGLAKALRWIEGGGGTIRMESQPGVGTRMMILLPMSAAEAASVSQMRESVTR